MITNILGIKSMDNSPKIMRKSIFILLKNFHVFTSTPSLVALPFALATLIFPFLASSSSLFPLVHHRVSSLFLASGLPRSSRLFTILNYKLSRTILSSFFASPFALSFLLLSKTFTIRALQHCRPLKRGTTFSWMATFRPLLSTYLCTTLLVLSTNATFFCLLIICFDCLEFLGLSSRLSHVFLSSTLATAYSIIIANAYIVCNLSVVLSGLERRGGFSSILKACDMTRGRIAAALSLTVWTNVAFFAIEALFQYRVVRAYHRAVAPNSWMVLEAVLVAYLYSLLLVLDTIVGCEFLKRCRHEYSVSCEDTHLYLYCIEIQEDQKPSEVKNLELVV